MESQFENLGVFSARMGGDSFRGRDWTLENVRPVANLFFGRFVDSVGWNELHVSRWT